MEEIHCDVMQSKASRGTEIVILLLCWICFSSVAYNKYPYRRQSYGTEDNGSSLSSFTQNTGNFVNQLSTFTLFVMPFKAEGVYLLQIIVILQNN